MTHNIIAYFHKYDWLCHLATFFIPINFYKLIWYFGTIFSDNGTPFVNDLIREFLKANGVRHLTAHHITLPLIDWQNEQYKPVKQH